MLWGCRWAAVAGAFALGVLLTWTCSFRLALLIAVILLLLLCKVILRR